MRKILLWSFSAGLLGLCVYLQAGPSRAQDDGVKIRVRLMDADGGKPVPGIVRVFRAGEDKPLALPGLYDRLRGLKPTATLAGWSVVPAAGAETTLPRAKVRIEAVSGLETVLAVEEIDLGKKPSEEVAVKLKTLFRPERSDLVAGNTHLHLMNLTAEDSDEYLKQVPAADRLKVLFISYLERIKEDVNYITNRYAIGDLKQFDVTGVLMNNGEEHRHNFGSHGEGYGHVMFLNINRLVKPVSLGSGITGAGDDDRPLRPGIEDARNQGGTVLWCHNASGFEGVPNTLAGRINALNVFDGTRTGTYEDSYYRYLNIGLRLPISTGTDWFLYDFSRVYAKVSGRLTVPKWLEAVKAGRCQATNGPLLTLSVDGKEPGDVITLDEPKTVRVEVTATGRHDFQKLQLVQNGRVVLEESGKLQDGVCAGRLAREVRLDGPAWFAARIDSSAKNELDRQLFAHTSPVYIDFAGKRVFDVEAGRLMLRRIEQAEEEIRNRGKFGDDAARDKILAIYQETSKELVKRIGRRGK
ncbi:MAG TPA: CehA/McbA family metallohydrolase [Gemmataceae bacterium]|nr:CehA/McbA family metallohydrolase [Gemmataceae bacterium]